MSRQGAYEVVLVSRSDVMLSGLRQALASLPAGWVREVRAYHLSQSSLASVVRQIGQCWCPLVLVDCTSLQDAEALALADMLRDRQPEVRCLFVVSHISPVRMVGFASLETTLGGVVCVEDRLMESLAGFVRQLLDSEAPAVFSPTGLEVYMRYGWILSQAMQLTRTQKQVLALMVEGSSPPEIANRLRKTVQNVYIHQRNIRQILGVHENADVIQMLRGAGRS